MSESVLVVDDDRAVRDLLCEALEAAGYTSHGASSAEEALEIVGRTAVDAAIVVRERRERE